MIDACGDLANYLRPRYVRFVDSFPTTPNGKVRKNELRERFAREGGDARL